VPFQTGGANLRTISEIVNPINSKSASTPLIREAIVMALGA